MKAICTSIKNAKGSDRFDMEFHLPGDEAKKSVLSLSLRTGHDHDQPRAPRHMPPEAAHNEHGDYEEYEEGQEYDFPNHHV